MRRLPAHEWAYLDQLDAGLDPGRSVLDNFRARHADMEETAVRYALARFLAAHAAALQRVGTLSGGQRLRAALACVLGGERTPSLLVLDEPTNYLDLDALDALDALESALRGYDGALLVASHDASFLEAIGIEREVRLGCGPRGRLHACVTRRPRPSPDGRAARPGAARAAVPWPVMAACAPVS